MAGWMAGLHCTALHCTALHHTCAPFQHTPYAHTAHQPQHSMQPCRTTPHCTTCAQNTLQHITAPHHTYNTTRHTGEECADTDNGATDSNGDSCSYYMLHSGSCGDYNAADFDALAMCCACGGGSAGGAWKCQSFVTNITHALKLATLHCTTTATCFTRV